MTVKNPQSENERRDFLRFSVGIASGIVLPAGFSACSHDGDDQNNPQQTFVQPPILESKNGLLDLTLTAAYWNTELSGADPDTKYSVSLRAYGYDTNKPSYAGPTLVIKGGDQLRIKLINYLPFNPPAAPNNPLLYMKPNTTNLHTHGLHVYPGIYPESTLAEYGDYVVDSNSGGVVPQGDTRQYVYNLPANHPAGPFYYHPQYHGSSAIQVASLMQGAIMVRGPVDELPAMAQATELIFLFQAPYFANNNTTDNYGVKNGQLEQFSQIGNHPTGFGLKKSSSSDGYIDAQPVLINGIRQPTIVMESGEVQRWRLINTQIFNYLNLNLDEHVLHQYTTDGWGSAQYQDYPDARGKDGRGIVLSAGNRSSVIVRAGKPGTYLLRSLPVKIAQGRQSVVLPGDVLAKVIVIGARRSPKKELATAIPEAPLPVSDFLKPITDDEFASSGGKKRSIIFNMVGNRLLQTEHSALTPLTKVSSYANAVLADISEAYQMGLEKAKQGIARVNGKSGEESTYTSPKSISQDQYQLQASNVMIQNVILGAVEEWTIFNFNNIANNFHIHVNPMYITKVNGVSIDPYWCDTVALPPGGTTDMPTSVTFRMRFNDFIGPYLLHSQMLQYSDLGLVQRVTVIPA